MLMMILLQLAKNLSRSQEGKYEVHLLKPGRPFWKVSQVTKLEMYKAGSPTHSQDFWSQAGSLSNDDECAVQLVLM